jgi:hypothetical protein
MRRLLWIGFLAATVTMTATCGESKVLDIVRGVPGELTLSLVTPNGGADGAILLVVKGPAPITSASVPSGSGLRLFAGPLGADSAKFAITAITGSVVNGAIVVLGVADVNRVASYNAFIRQVAANDYTLRSLAGYGITVSR